VSEPPEVVGGRQGPTVRAANRLALVVLAAVAVGSGACGGPSVPSAPSTPAPLVYGKGELRNVYCTHDSAPVGRCGGLVGAPEGVSDRIVLDSTVARAGTTIRGDLVVTNSSGSAIELRDPHGCTPGYTLGLTNASLPTANAPGFAAVCGYAALVLPPGTTKFPIEAITTYMGCTNGPQRPGPGVQMPRCLPHGGPPSLPPGRYVALLFGSSLALPQATVQVTLVRSSSVGHR
jgi:hypothetical protein